MEVKSEKLKVKRNSTTLCTDMKKIPIIAVVGPTASGKTEVGIRLAQAFDGEVICVDSRTVYRGMNIGTAKIQGKQIPETEFLTIHSLFAEKPIVVDGVAHWGVDLVDPDEAFTVADFKEYAEKKISDIVGRGKLPILVGGTGLYFRALLDGLTLTDVEPDVALRNELDAMSTEALAEMLGALDPDAASTIDVDNRRRLVRAIEIVRTTGEPLAARQQIHDVPYDVLYVGMDVERDELYARIDERVAAMIGGGLIDEARSLYEKYGSTSQAMSGIGYRQLAAFFENKLPLRDAVERIQFDTRHYAKRQLTWFKANPRVHWVTNVKDAIATVRKFISVHP